VPGEPSDTAGGEGVRGGRVAEVSGFKFQVSSD
jgi:hypothetical protein